jgi:hypothetical protein
MQASKATREFFELAKKNEITKQFEQMCAFAIETLETTRDLKYVQHDLALRFHHSLNQDVLDHVKNRLAVHATVVGFDNSSELVAAL